MSHIFKGRVTMDKIIEFHKRREFMCANQTGREDEIIFHHNTVVLLENAKEQLAKNKASKKK